MRKRIASAVVGLAALAGMIAPNAVLAAALFGES